MHGLVHRHLSRRKRQEIPPVTDPGPWIKVLDKATVIAGVIGPLMTLPQIWEIYYLHNAAGVSAASWAAFGILDIPFILYGIAHKDQPIVSTYILWLIANFAVAIGAIVYG